MTAQTHTAHVIDVHDGDTVKVSVPLASTSHADSDLGFHVYAEKHHLGLHLPNRLLGSNAIEPNDPRGTEARHHPQPILPSGAPAPPRLRCSLAVHFQLFPFQGICRVWGGGNSLPGIRVKEGESFESALRRFKKKCEKAGIMADLRRHQHFEKPSERRKRKMNAAKRKNIARRASEN